MRNELEPGREIEPMHGIVTVRIDGETIVDPHPNVGSDVPVTETNPYGIYDTNVGEIHVMLERDEDGQVDGATLWGETLKAKPKGDPTTWSEERAEMVQGIRKIPLNKHGMNRMSIPGKRELEIEVDTPRPTSTKHVRRTRHNSSLANPSGKDWVPYWVRNKA